MILRDLFLIQTMYKSIEDYGVIFSLKLQFIQHIMDAFCYREIPIIMAATTTKKYRWFVSEPIGDKPVDHLPGIGNVIKGHFAARGITKAYQVLGQFLVLDKNRVNFCEWLRGFGMNRGQTGACCQCIKEWCDHFML